MPPLTPPLNPASRNRIVPLVVGGLTLLVWLPTLWNDFVDWDDLLMIVSNPRFNPPSLSGVGWYWTHIAWNLYQPLTCTLWGMLARIGWVQTPDQFGGHMNPMVFHLAGMLLHTGATLFLLAILRRAVNNDWAAAVGALVFALHPLQTEAVAFAGALNNPLFACFGLLAIWQYLRWIDSRSRSHWIVGTLALILAMLAKPTAVVVPPIAFVLDLAIHRQKWTVALRSIAPWIGLIVPCVIWTKLAQQGAVAGAQAPLWFRPFIAGDSAAFYLVKLVAPARLCIDYGRNPEFLYAHSWAYATWLLPAAVLAAALALRHRYPLLAAGTVIFFLALLPNSGLLPFDYQAVSTTADRYAYLALAGVSIALAALLERIAVRSLATVGVILLAILSVATVRQMQIWRNGETLFNRTLAINPRSWTSWSNLANVIADSRPAEAIDYCHRAITLKPDFAFAYNNLGSILMAQGQPDAALAAFTQAYRFDPDNPTISANYTRARAANRSTQPTTQP